MNLAQARKFLKDNAVRYVLAQFVDIHGVAKTKSVPVSHFEDILKDGAGFAGFAVWGMGMAPHDPDYMGVAPFGFAYPVGWYGDYGNWNDNNRGNNDGGHGGGGGGGGGHGGR